MPFQIGDADRVNELAAELEHLLLAWGCDRASVNIAMFKEFWDIIHHEVDNCVLPHLELCGSHGVSLSKARAPGLKEITVLTHNFGRLCRQGKNLDALRTSIYQNVLRNCRVVQCPPTPEIVLQRQAALYIYIYI